MKKILIIAIAAMFGAFASGVSAQSFSNRSGKLVIGGSGGTDLTNTLTLTTTGTALGAPKTFTFPAPGLGLFHSTAAGVLSLSLIDLNSSDVPADVTGILQPINGGSGVANNNSNTITLGGPISTSNNFTTTGGNVTIVGPFNGTPATTGNSVQYNQSTIQNTATTTGGDYLFNVAYGTTNAAAANGAVINSTTTFANSSATGLAITSVGTSGGTSTGLTVSSTGGTNNYAATFTNGSVGIGTAAPNTSLDIVQDVSTREYANSTNFAATQDNVAFDAGTNQFGMVRLGGAPAAAFTITSIAGPQNGKRMTIYNASGKTMTLANQSAAAGATAANKIITSTGADLTIATGGSATLVYSNGDSRWVVQGTSNGNSGGGGGGTPGGATTQVQYNNAGAFAGSSNLTWDNTNGRLAIGAGGLGNTALDITKDLSTREFANSTAFGASTDNVAFDGGTNQFAMVRLGGAPAGAFTITSIAGPQNGKHISIYNASGQTMTLANQSAAAGATAANKIITGTGADVTVASGGTANLLYSAGDSRWIMQSSSNGNVNTGLTGFATPAANSVSISAPSAGVATTAMRSDATLQLDQSIVPTWSGNHTFSASVVVGGTTPAVALDVAKDYATRENANTTVFNGGTDNVAFDGGTNQMGLVRLGGTATGAFNFTSIAGPANGKRLTVYNNTGKTMTLTNQAGTGTAANKIITGTGADVAIPTGGVADLVYSNTDQRWILKSTSNGNSSTPVLFARKTADVALAANSTVLANDADLVLTLQANATYEFSGVVAYNGSAAASDLKLAFTIPTGATMRWSADQGGTANTPTSTTTSGGALSAFACSAAPADNLSVFVSGIVITGANSGSLQLQEAQNTNQANTTTILTNSHLKATRVK